jgi:AcrR family transcriptional regulator
MLAQFGTNWYRSCGYTVLLGTNARNLIELEDKKPVIAKDNAGAERAEPSLRERALKAAFEVFRKRGFSGASTLEIATRAKVSKRDLYALFGSKQAMMVACIRERASRMRQPLELSVSVPANGAAVAATLVAFGTSILRFVSHPDVLTVHRLAIAESGRAPEIARTLDRNGREANHAALADWLAKAQAQDLVGAGDPAAMAAHFIAILWGGGLLTQLLLRMRDAPNEDEIKSRAEAATRALLALYAPRRTAS